MTYTCRLRLRYGMTAKYALDVYYKKHWYSLERYQCLQLIYSDEELDNFLEEFNMENIIEKIKFALKDEIETKDNKEIKIKMNNFNKKYKNIKIEI